MLGNVNLSSSTENGETKIDYSFTRSFLGGVGWVGLKVVYSLVY